MTGESDRFEEPQAADTPRQVRTPSEPNLTAKHFMEDAHMCADSPDNRLAISELALNNEQQYQAKEEAENHPHYQRNARNSAHRNANHHHHNHHHHNQLHPTKHYHYQYSNPYDCYKNTSHCEFKKFMNNNNDDMDLDYLKPPSPLRYQRSRSTSLPFLTLDDLSPLQKAKPLRVIVLGDAGVGKTSLVMQYVSSVFGEYNDYESVLSGEIASFPILPSPKLYFVHH